MKRYALFFLCLSILFLGIISAQERKLQVKKSITVISPKAGDEFQTTDMIQVSWRSQGIIGNLKASLYKYQQPGVQTYGKKLPLNGSLSWPASKITPGRYYVRIQEVNGDFKGDSGVFSVLPKLDKPELTKREPRTIEVTIPAQIRDRHSREHHKRGDPPDGPDFPTEPSFKSRNGMARVGFEHFRRGQNDKNSITTNFYYRSRLFFDLDQFIGKKGILLEAKLKLKHISAMSDVYGKSTCGYKLYVLTGFWELPVKCTETPGYFYKLIPPNENHVIFNMVQQVRDWINGTEVNHGLLLSNMIVYYPVGQNLNSKCVSYYTAELYIKFREYF